MAKKKVLTILKIQVEAGKATPAPPVGTALGPHGVNIQQFCSMFNDMSKDRMGEVVPVEMTIFEDRTFELKLKTAPAAFLIKKAAGIEKGSGVPNKNKVGSITRAQAQEIAEKKMVDLNANDIEAATKIIEGTAMNMGIVVKD